MYLSKTISNAIESGVRRIKVLLFGGADVRTAQQATPFGIDSAPVKDLIAVYSDTGMTGQQVIVGYLNKSLVANTGEIRLFSTNSNGEVQFYAWLKNDGTLHLNGDADNLVRYSKLEDGYNQLKSDLNDLITKWNTFAGAYVPGSPTTVGLPASASTATLSTATITAAKIEEIKTT